VARGYFAEAALGPVEARLRAMLGAAGVPLAGFYYCPHHPEGSVEAYTTICQCRKPAPGLLEQAAHDHGIDLGQSWLVGDILHDVEAGRQAGCRTILLDVGNETEWDLTPTRTPDHVVATLRDAAHLILASSPRLHGVPTPPAPLSLGESAVVRESSPSRGEPLAHPPLASPLLARPPVDHSPLPHTWVGGTRRAR
jgi:histidinol-phosphate phosphatase family protein